MMAMPMPTPVMSPPTPVPMVPMPMPMTSMMPAHLLGLQMIDIVLGNNGRFHVLGARWREPLMRHDWRQWPGIRSGSQRCGACDRAKRE
jgi:hypothetical protein